MPRKPLESEPKKQARQKGVLPAGFDPEQIRSLEISQELTDGRRGMAAENMLRIVLQSGDTLLLPIKDFEKIARVEDLTVIMTLQDGQTRTFSSKDPPDRTYPEANVIDEILTGHNLFLCRFFQSMNDYSVYKRNALLSCQSSDKEYRISILNSWPKYSNLNDIARKYLAMTCISLVRAEQAYDHDDIRSTQLLILRANTYHLLFEIEAEAIRKNEIRTSRGNGGRRTGESHMLIKKECIRLLHERRPPGGWRSAASAARTIQDDLFKFSEKHPGASKNLGSRDDGVAPAERLNSTIMAWIADDDRVRSAFYNQSGRPSSM